MADNLDLQARRKRLHLNQRQVAQALGIKRPAYISEFETAAIALPNGLTKEDYEGLLERLEREAGILS